MQFKEYIVDEGNAKVFVRGTGRFVWTTTGEAWHECFVYLLDFVKDGDGDGDGWKVGRYQVWADSGAGEAFSLFCSFPFLSVFFSAEGCGVRGLMMG